MLEKTVFLEYFTVLSERFGKQFSQPTVREYYRCLSELENEQFICAARACFEQDEFFPKPQRLIELGKPSQDPAHQAFLPPSSEEYEPPPEEVKQAIQTLLGAITSKGQNFSKLHLSIENPIPEPSPEEKYLQDLARFTSYCSSYEAYRDTQRFADQADQALALVKSLDKTAHPKVAAMCEAFVTQAESEAIAEDGHEITDAIVALIDDDIEYELEEDF